MKSFGNIQQLWDYCLFCPLCQENCRRVWVQVGPEPSFDLSSSNKTDDVLILCCTYKLRGDLYAVDYTIDCLDNTVDIQMPRVPFIPGCDLTTEPPKDIYFYYYIQGECSKCTRSFVASQDIELNSPDAIALEIESFNLDDNNLRLNISHIDDIMEIDRQSLNSDYYTVYLSEDKALKLPLMELDWSDPAKVVERIKVLSLFS